jgi:peptidyl-dipeptidase Dcp
MQRRQFIQLSAGTLTALLLQPTAQVAEAAPLLDVLNAPWPGPYLGLPPFDKIKMSDFDSALETAMKSYRAELRQIVVNRAASTFESVIVALENSGRAYNRISTLFGVYTSTKNTAEMQALERKWSPKFAAFRDEMIQNSALFAKVSQVYRSSQKDPKLSGEQRRLAWVYYDMFAHSGAQLNEAQKKELRETNQKLAALYTKFSQNVLADEENEHVVLDKPEDFAGLPDTLVAAVKAAAKDKKLEGKGIVRNTRSAIEPFLTYSSRRDLREKVFKMYVSRGDNANAHNNNQIVSQILELRAKFAHLLGNKTYAHWKLENSMAKKPETAMKLMMDVWPAAVARVKEEVAEMQALADREGAKHKIEAWDYRYYAEKVRKAKYDLDENEVKPYLQLEKMRDAIFYMAKRLYAFEFKQIQGVPLIHPDVTVYEVTRKGKTCGVWYFDPYARNGKSSGAWMNEYRTQEKFSKDVFPIVSNNANFIKASPTLLSFDDAETLFHEFGHALHGLNSNAHYPTVAGTNTPRDFVEFPSQLHENWFKTPEILSKFAIHYKTGEAIPKSLLEKIEKAATFNQGFAVTEFMASAIVDMKLHLDPTGKIDPAAFEKKTLQELGMPSEIVMRHRIPQFNHLFSGDGYSAGYYSYLWSQVLDHDAWEVFEEAGDPFDAKAAEKLQRCIMSVGNTMDPAQAYRNFRGRDPQIRGYLKAHGFPTKS